MKTKALLLASALLFGLSQQASALTVQATTLDTVDVTLDRDGGQPTTTVGFTGLQDALAGTSVIFSVDARGDLDGANEVILTSSNGTNLGQLFDYSYTPSNSAIHSDTLTLAAATYNGLLAGGSTLNFLLSVSGTATSWADLSAASLDFTPVPLPASLPLLAAALFGFGAYRRHVQQQS